MTNTDRRSFLRSAALLLVSGAALAAGLWRGASEWRARHRPSGSQEPGGGTASQKGGREPADSEQALGSADPAAQIVAALRGEFAYLQIEPEVLERFAIDHLADRRRSWLPGQPFPASENARFLMSTDFFQNGADEARPLRYVAYYQPYQSPCYNPLARLAEAGAA